MLAGPTVLVVEDDEATRDAIAELLGEEGYAVATAGDGAAGLRAAEGTRPKLVLLDVRMPVLDGADFARAFRAAAGPRASLVVMTAAYDAAQWAADLDADGYLAKPFGTRELLAVVARHTGGLAPEPCWSAAVARIRRRAAGGAPAS